MVGSILESCHQVGLLSLDNSSQVQIPEKENMIGSTWVLHHLDMVGAGSNQ